MPKTTKPMRKREIEAIEAPKRLRICELCGRNYRLGTRKIDKKLCDRCYSDKHSVVGKAKSAHLRLQDKGFEGSLSQQLSDYEATVKLRADELLSAYVSTMQQFGSVGNESLLTLTAPAMVIEDHEATNEFTPFLKQMFLELYVKMPRQDVMVLEHLGVSEVRYRKDLKEYPEFHNAVLACDRKHLKLLEIVSYHNALNPKATSERIFLLKAGDPARYRESYKGDTFNMGQVNITVSSNIAGLGIPKNAIAGGKAGK